MLFLIILILSYACGFFMPWWVAAVVAFLAAFWMGKRTFQAFLTGFFAIAITWITLAICKSIPNNNLLATRVAHLMHLPAWGWLLAVMALIGGLVGGMAAMSGFLLRSALKK